MRVVALAALLFLVAGSVGYGSSDGAVGMSGATRDSGGSLALVGHVLSISCGAPGDCVAGGDYIDGIGRQQAFVVSETNGIWGTAIEVPGTATLNSGGFAGVNSVSCSAAGACVAGGYYADGAHYAGPYDSRSQAFVVSEANGKWGKAIEVPRTGTLNAGARAEVDSISCGAAGHCTAGGSYTDRKHSGQAFLADETNGTWGDASKVPGVATLSTMGGSSQVTSVSCAAAGDCTAGGYFYSDGGRPFVVDETNGSWGKAIEVPGMRNLNEWHGGHVDSLSCAAAGECAAGGSYWDGHSYQVFVVSETNGSWGDAIEPPGWTSLNNYWSDSASFNAVSCGAAGDCAAGGGYDSGPCFVAAWVASETNGSWVNAIKVPGSGCYAVVNSISCAAAGECAAGGYSDGQPFVVSETNGSWGDAAAVPGTEDTSSVKSISCAAPGECAAGGGPYDGQPFVVSETSGSWSDAVLVSFAGSCVVPNVAEKTINAAKTMLKHAHCGVGKITNVYSNGKKGLVIEQGPTAGGTLTPGTPIALTVSKGKQPPASTRWRATIAKLPANAAAAGSQAISVSSISCASRGNCTAVGSYYGNAGDQEGLLLTEKAGHWARGVEAVLPANAVSDPQVSLSSVSCASAGHCTAVGTYSDGSGGIYSEGGGQGLLLTETAGHWAAGVEAVLPANASPDPGVSLHAVSCASPGNCTAVGSYVGNDGDQEGLLLTEKAGHWKRGVAYGAPSADIFSVSCSSDGSCGAVGYDNYYDGGRNGTPSGDGLLLTKKGGKWRNESGKVFWPGGPGEAASLTSISCPSAGNCGAVGVDGIGIDEEFAPRGSLLTEKAGKWAYGVPAKPPKNAHSAYWKGVGLVGISCASAGNCGAVGIYYTHGNSEHWTLLTEKAGKWRRGVEAALPPSVNGSEQPVLSAISCASPGNCTFVGSYIDSEGNVVYGEDGTSGLLLTEIGGSLGRGVSAPFPTNSVVAVSCASPGNCGAVGGDSRGDGILLDSTTRGNG